MRVVLLSDHRHARRLASAVGQALTETAVAFGHSIIVKEMNIGSLPAAQVAASLTQASAVAVVCEDRRWSTEFAQELDCRMRMRRYRFHPSLSELSLLKSGMLPRGIIASPLGDIEDQAFIDQASAIAKREGLQVRSVTAPGTENEPWTGPGLATLYRLRFHQALDEVLRRPDQIGFLAAHPFGAALLDEVATAVCGVPSMVYDLFFSPSLLLFHTEAPDRNRADDSFNPLGGLLAASELLSFLGLSKEADCLFVSVSNVLEAGWRTEDIAGPGSMRIGTQAMCRLVFEQISLVGQLVNP